MARRIQRVTHEEIFAAADDIAASGETPTLEGVRQLVGGSFNTLGPALREWREQQAAAAAPPPGEEIPGPVQKQLQELGKRLWAEVAEQSRQKVQAERDAVQRDRQEMQAAQEEIGATADRLARRVEELEGRCAALQEEVGGLREELEAATRAAAQSSARADELRRQLDATRQSLCADLVERVAALESSGSD